MSITIYTDGSAKGNPGPGGFGIVLLSNEGHRKEVFSGFRKTTNNRMELLSVIVALELLKNPPLNVVIFSDSKYVVDAVEKKWLFNWEKNNFHMLSRKLLLNINIKVNMYIMYMATFMGTFWAIHRV